MDPSDLEVAPFEEERGPITGVLRALYGPDAAGGYAELRLRPGHPGVRVPLSAVELLASACTHMQFGAAIRLHRLPEELTREEAERFLGTVADGLTAALASGELPSHRSTESRVRREHVLRLLRSRRGGSSAKLRDLATDPNA